MTSPVHISMDIQSADVSRMLNAVNTVLSPLALMGFMSATISPFIRQRAQRRFMNEGDEVVGRWAPLMPSTQEIRQHSNLPIGAEHPINRRTGDLYQYITQSPDAVTNLGGQGAMLTYPGSQPISPAMSQKLSTAQKGRPNPRTVARPVLGVGMADLVYVIGQLAVGIKAAGGYR